MADPPPRRGPGDWLLAAEAALWMAVAGVALRVLTFARLAALASRRPWEGARSDWARSDWARGEGSKGVQASSPYRSPNMLAPEAEAARIGWAIGAAASRAPWRAMCFERGLAAHLMLRRRGRESTLYYGARAGVALDAHVWVRLGEADVVGGEEAPAYAILATFPPRG